MLLFFSSRLISCFTSHVVGICGVWFDLISWLVHLLLCLAQKANHTAWDCFLRSHNVHIESLPALYKDSHHNQGLEEWKWRRKLFQLLSMVVVALCSGFCFATSGSRRVYKMDRIMKGGNMSDFSNITSNHPLKQLNLDDLWCSETVTQNITSNMVTD